MADDGSDFEVPDNWKTNNRIISDQIQRTLDLTGNLSCMIPLLFRYNGKPVTLTDHYPFEICFYHNRPRRVIYRCGRQVGKSFQNALQLILRSILIPNWNSLYVTPMFEQVRRFSTQYVSALIDESPAKRLMNLKGASKQVLQRTLGNRSTLYFTYALRDANRARGINANEVWYDEVQLMSSDVFPVLQQVMGGSRYGEYEAFAGTPLSFQNNIERLFRKSTMSEWMIRCRHCSYDNVASYERDLMKMIGPVHDGIHPGGIDAQGKHHKRMSGLVCARCSPHNARPENLKPLFPEDGHWFHKHPERRNSFVGIHVPQPICPWHAYSHDRWVKLNNRVAVGSDMEIFNEILGEPCDSGFKPISEKDLKAAACLGHPNTLDAALKASKLYPRLAMGIDWGGGGMSGVSRTKAAIVGLTVTGKSDVLFGVDLNFCHNAFAETQALMLLAMKFGVEMIAHDVGGGVGSTREALMYQTRTLNATIVPMSYIGPMSQSLMRFNAPTVEGQTGTWTVDKARSLTYLCQAIKQGHVRFFDYDYVNDDNKGLLNDFAALISEIQHNAKTSDILLIDREEGSSDDFAHAVNFGLLALWSQHSAFPKLNLSQAAASIQQLQDTVHLIRDAESYSVEEIENMLRMLSTGA